ncbi:MOSC domain-containing protein [Glycomyces luteolus]|uniref:MOSC domain-containing protein n=1 Tax=Glycomyces luteolus TaxID=2670330 RepID=A0A9X3SSM6_9ACTN|nr:MOSC domain-containing protein [Glycomyces luteolus]MDA1362741.1 MOSC domain-containing protein [Glycomyces luteolus]
MNRVLGIRRHPLKSAAAEHIGDAFVGKHGLDGDRTWTCLDADGTIGSAKQPRLWGGLLAVSAAFDPASGGVRIAVPGRSPAPAGSPEADAAVSALLGRPVRLTRTATQQLKRHHWWPDEPGMIPDWAADAEPGGDDIVNVRSSAADGRFFDYGALHLVTTGALERLGAEHGGPVDPARFRPNLILDLPGDPLPGQRITIGPDLVVQVSVPTPRCVIPSLSHGDAPADRALLKTLAAHHRVDVPAFGRATCFGFYADILAVGAVRTGDRASVTD